MQQMLKKIKNKKFLKFKMTMKVNNKINKNKIQMLIVILSYKNKIPIKKRKKIKLH